jgi:ATP-dependent RNA circularization protein (DNA/RNA ligase family)
LNTRTGNAEIHNIVESLGEPVSNTIVLKQRDFATCKNIKIVNSYYQHENVHTYAWSANNSRTFRDCFIANRKLSRTIPRHESLKRK